MTKTILFAIASLLLAAPAAAYDYASIPDNTWVMVESGGITDPPGSTKPVRGICAYSGMAWDSEDNLLLVFGGGHADYAGNEVWKFDVASATWTRPSGPDAIADPATLCPDGYDNATYPGAVFNPSGESLADAAPLTRHTYDADEWVPGYGMFIGGAFTWGGGTDPDGTASPVTGYSDPCYSWNPMDTWYYDPTANKWTWKNVSRQTQPNGDMICAAYDPITGKIYYCTRYSQTWSYEPSTDTWTQLSPAGTPTAAGELCMDYDSKRHVMWRVGGWSPTNNEVWKYDIASNSWAKMSPTGTAPPASGGLGVAYDSTNDVVVVHHGNNSSYGGGWTYVYDPTANTWANVSPTTEPPTYGDVHGDMKYDSTDNVTLLLTFDGYTMETWAYRYASGSPPSDVTPPDAPGSIEAHKGQ